MYLDMKNLLIVILSLLTAQVATGQYSKYSLHEKYYGPYGTPSLNLRPGGYKNFLPEKNEFFGTTIPNGSVGFDWQFGFMAKIWFAETNISIPATTFIGYPPFFQLRGGPVILLGKKRLLPFIGYGLSPAMPDDPRKIAWAETEGVSFWTPISFKESPVHPLQLKIEVGLDRNALRFYPIFSVGVATSLRPQKSY